jgi:hypothetical protein
MSDRGTLDRLFLLEKVPKGVLRGGNATQIGRQGFTFFLYPFANHGQGAERVFPLVGTEADSDRRQRRFLGQKWRQTRIEQRAFAQARLGVQHQLVFQTDNFIQFSDVRTTAMKQLVFVGGKGFEAGVTILFSFGHVLWQFSG